MTMPTVLEAAAAKIAALLADRIRIAAARQGITPLEFVRQNEERIAKLGARVAVTATANVLYSA